MSADSPAWTCTSLVGRPGAGGQERLPRDSGGLGDWHGGPSGGGPRGLNGPRGPGMGRDVECQRGPAERVQVPGHRSLRQNLPPALVGDVQPRPPCCFLGSARGQHFPEPGPEAGASQPPVGSPSSKRHIQMLPPNRAKRECTHRVPREERTECVHVPRVISWEMARAMKEADGPQACGPRTGPRRAGPALQPGSPQARDPGRPEVSVQLQRPEKNKVSPSLDSQAGGCPSHFCSIRAFN